MIIRAVFLWENTAVQITEKTPQREPRAAISKSGALNFPSQTTQRHNLPFAFSVSSSLRCPFPATAHVVETRVGAGIWNGTETPAGINPGISMHSRGYQKIKPPVSIHNHRFLKNPPFILHNLGSQKIKYWVLYTTMVLKKSSTRFWYITMVLKCFWKKIKYLPRTARLWQFFHETRRFFEVSEIPKTASKILLILKISKMPGVNGSSDSELFQIPGTGGYYQNKIPALHWSIQAGDL
jgi:hypothetical protein